MLYIILMEISKYNSPNYDKKARSSKSITCIIIHYTGMQSERESLQRLIHPKSRVSCHYLISRNGKIFNLVKEKNIAWHAGKSKWQNYKDLNKNSIGIELVNKGHRFGYQSFTSKQINALVILCKSLKRKYKIKNSLVLGHSDISPLRKIDPGEKFPWRYLSSKGIGIYPKTRFKNYKKLKNTFQGIFFKNLHNLGYRYLNTALRKRIVKNFQRRYRQSNINGEVDKETFKISEFLTKKAKIS